MTEISPLRDAITKSTKLAGEGSYDQSFKILDDAIAEASGQNNTLWVLTLCHHAAIVVKFAGDQRERQYYEKSLSSSPENPRALFGLASVAKDAGDFELAKQYAVRCYEAILVSDDEIIKMGLTDMVLKSWPDVARK